MLDNRQNGQHKRHDRGAAKVDIRGRRLVARDRQPYPRKKDRAENSGDAHADDVDAVFRGLSSRVYAVIAKKPMMAGTMSRRGRSRSDEFKHAGAAAAPCRDLVFPGRMQRTDGSLLAL